MTDFAPWYEIELRILVARAAVRLSDANGARAALVTASRRCGRARGVVLEGLAAGHVGAARRVHRTGQRTGFGADPRGAADPPVPANALLFREIAERTYVSANTVKSQANAVYRKLMSRAARRRSAGRARSDCSTHEPVGRPARRSGRALRRVIDNAGDSPVGPLDSGRPAVTWTTA